MADNQITFRSVPPAGYSALLSEASKDGIMLAPLAPNANTVSGEVHSHDCLIGYAYSRTAQTVVLTVLDKPWLFPMATVLGQLRDVVTSAMLRAGVRWAE